MAVRHLMDSQRPQLSSAYRTGYSRCASEVKGYLHQAPANSEDVQKRLLGHLSHGAPRAASTPARICRPQPMLAHTAPLTDGEHKVTVMARHGEEEDSCLNCSTVSSTSSSTSSSTALSPARERHDSALSEDYCLQERCAGLDCVSTSDIHSYSSSAFRQVGHSAGASLQTHKACSVVDYSVDSDTEENEARPQGQQVCQGNSPVWRPW